MKTLTLLISVLVSLPARAGVAVSGAASARGGSPAGLPACIDAAQAKALVATEKGSLLMNPTTHEIITVYPKYKFIQDALKTDSDLELMTRLVYSETKAARCPNDSGKLTDPIAAVVVNRVNARDGDVRAVVFTKDQFASSLNDYDESGYKEFMCPTDENIWNLARASVRRAQTAPVSTGRGYYLFRHFADNPAKMAKYNALKAKQTSLPFAGSERIRDCLRLYPR